MLLFIDPFIHSANIYWEFLLCPRHGGIELSAVLTPQEVMSNGGTQASRQTLTRQEEKSHGRSKDIGLWVPRGKALKEA